MKLAITDANIFIDLFKIGLIDQFLELDIELYTSIEVLDELEEDQQQIILGRQKLTVLTEGDIDYLEELEQRFSNRLSPADLSVFHHAKEMDAGILTGDSILWKVSEEMQFEVYGILWVLETMVESSLLVPVHAINKLEILMKFNKRLPTKECNKILKKWSK